MAGATLPLRLGCATLLGDANFSVTHVALRATTIAAGVICGAALVVAYMFNAPVAAGSSNLAAQDVFNAVIYIGAAAWFAANSLRWLQERLLQPWNHIAFGAIALAALGIGARTTFDIVVDPPNGTTAATYQAILTCSLFAIGAVATFSALQRPETPDDPKGVRFNGLIRRHIVEIAPGHATLHLVSRWVAFAGGVVFATAQLASPAVIPATVAITCTVRFASTHRGGPSRRAFFYAVAAIAVVAVHVTAITLFPDEAFFTIGLVVSAFLMLIALASSTLAGNITST